MSKSMQKKKKSFSLHGKNPMTETQNELLTLKIIWETENIQRKNNFREHVQIWDL